MDEKIDFGKNKDGTNWRAINDGVMGGLSQGKVSFTENSVCFAGAVSLENNGGFASFRSPFQMMDLSGFETINIRLKCKGQTFALVLETDERWYMPNYKTRLAVTSEDWETFQIKLTDFRAHRIGRPMDYRLAAADLQRILRVGLITDDKKAGPFQLDIDAIWFE